MDDLGHTASLPQERFPALRGVVVASVQQLRVYRLPGTA
jgi:hypothetical protein